MDKELQDKVDRLVKSLHKSISEAKKRNAIEDVLDSNRVAEMSPDSVAPDSTAAVKKDEDDCECEKKDNCKCDKAPVEENNIHKAEETIKTLVKGFELISQAYLLKKEESRMATNREMQSVRDKKQSNELWHKWKKQAKKFQDHQKQMATQGNNQDSGDQDMAASEGFEDKCEPISDKKECAESSCDKK